jgi:hypothetical protein
MITDIIEQIHARFAEEQTNPPVLRTASDIPVSYDAISAEWLTAVLCADYPGAWVEGFRLDAPDTGTSNRRRIFLDINAAGQAAGLPTSIFCKATHDLVNRLILSNGGIISETTFYNIVRDMIDIDAPRALHAAYDPVSYASIIILPDMAAEVIFCDQNTPVTKEMAESQLDLLGRLHGQFYESPLFDTVLAHTKTWPGRFRSLIARHDMELTCVNGFRDAEAVVPQSLFARSSEIWEATLKSVARHDELPWTLNHGDVHLKNWYIRNAPKMGLSDWQSLNRGHWARDLAYVITTALCVEDRRRWERDLIAYYLERQHEAGAPKVNFDEAWLNYRQQLFGALAFWTQTMAPTKDMPEMQPKETTLEFIHRLSHAVDDLDSLNSFSN